MNSLLPPRKTCNANYLNHIIEITKFYLPELNDDVLSAFQRKHHLHKSWRRIQIDQAIQILTYISKLNYNGRIGLQVGSQFKPGSFGLLGFACMFCNNLRDAILLNEKFQSLNQQFGVTRLSETKQHAIMSWHSQIPYPANQLICEAALSGYANFGRWLAWNPSLPIELVQFNYSQPGDIKHYQDVFGCEVQFDCKHTAIYFGRDNLNVELQHTNEALRQQIVRLLEIQLQTLQENRTTTFGILEYLGKTIGNSKPTLAHAAEFLQLSERSLKRKLAQESTSFSTILSDQRKTLAHFYLSDTDIALADVAIILGFVDQSAFTRAFKSWYKQTPAAFRRKQESPRNQTLEIVP